jgi:hypothetical protein
MSAFREGAFMRNLPQVINRKAADWKDDGWPSVKVTKNGATYVFRHDTDYRCEDCWKWLPDTEQCLEFRPQDVVKAHGYCSYWSFGEPGMIDAEPTGSYLPEELGYSEDPHGTQCHRCIYKNPGDDTYCHRVDESSPGDTPGQIHPNGCCANQEPRE